MGHGLRFQAALALFLQLDSQRVETPFQRRAFTHLTDREQHHEHRDHQQETGDQEPATTEAAEMAEPEQVAETIGDEAEDDWDEDEAALLAEIDAPSDMDPARVTSLL